MSDVLKKDAARYTKTKMPRFQKLYRKCQTSKMPMKFVYRVLYSMAKKKNHIEIPYVCKIGAGLYIGHAYCITLNADVVMGENCNIHKGVTIGQENRGKRKGTPKIGNCVWIGINSTIVGNITIGDDVLIAPNTYVNCDIPPHSIVFGNPCIIKSSDNATQDYIINKI